MGQPLDEAELVQRARRGDHDAYRRLLREHERIAFRTAFAIVASAADAEDVTQEAFVKAYRALGRFRAGRPFRPWLLRIVANEARNRARGDARRQASEARAAAQEAIALEAVTESSSLVEDERRQLFAAIAELSREDRLAIIGRYFLDLSDAEAAAALGIRRSAVKMRVHRALERLRFLLEQAP